VVMSIISLADLHLVDQLVPLVSNEFKVFKVSLERPELLVRDEQPELNESNEIFDLSEMSDLNELLDFCKLELLEPLLIETELLELRRI